VDCSWSDEAESLREIAVKTPDKLTQAFILKFFKSLRIVDKKVISLYVVIYSKSLGTVSFKGFTGMYILLEGLNQLVELHLNQFYEVYFENIRSENSFKRLMLTRH